MKKYLLLTTCASHQDDDDMLTNSGSAILGSFDTVEEAIAYADSDLKAEAMDMAINETCGDNPEEVEAYVEAYLADTIYHDIYEDSFTREGAYEHIIESEYHSDSWCDSRVYTIVRIA